MCYLITALYSKQTFIARIQNNQPFSSMKYVPMFFNKYSGSHIISYLGWVTVSHISWGVNSYMRSRFNAGVADPLVEKWWWWPGWFLVTPSHSKLESGLIDNSPSWTPPHHHHKYHAHTCTGCIHHNLCQACLSFFLSLLASIISFIF